MAPGSRKRKSNADQVHDDPPQEVPSESSGSKRQKHLPVRAKEDESSATDAPIAQPASASGKGTLVVFDDDDDFLQPTTVTTVKESTRKAPIEEDEEDSDDDDAPEAVSTQQVASQLKKSASISQKAAQEHAAAQKRKRQQRDALFKQQAEERKKVGAEAAEVQDVARAPSTVVQPGSTRGRKRGDKIPIPDLLPAEFLTDSSSEDEEEDTATSVRPKRRNIAAVEKRLSYFDKAPKDKMAGSTVYRVAKKVDERLAPKLRRSARGSREVLLKRNRSAAKPRKGFFTKS